MIRGITVASALALGACTFAGPGGQGQDAPSLGEPDMDRTPEEPAPDAPDGEPDADAPSSDTDDAPRPDDGDGGNQPLPPPSDPSDDDDGGAADDGDAGETGGTGDGVDVDVDCVAGFVDLLWAADAELTTPMSLGEASEAIDAPLVALSAIADEGEVTFELDLPCAGDYYVFGLMWDHAAGAWADPDADSFYVDVAGPEFVWRYGCQTAAAIGGLSWQPLERLDGQPCEATPIVLQATAPGVYPMTLRNREAGSGSAVAGVAAIVITTDPTLDPYGEYTPY